MGPIRIRTVAVVLVGLLTAACDATEAGRPPSGPEPDRGSQVRSPAERGSPAAPAAPDRPTGAERSPGPGEDETIALIDEAARSSGGSTCDQIYAGIEAMSDQTGETPPDQQAFLGACGALPEEVQRCMMPSYRMAHMETCNRAYSELDPALDAAMEQVWSGRADRDEGAR